MINGTNKLAVSIALAFALTACGGSGESSDTVVTPSPSAPSTSTSTTQTSTQTSTQTNTNPPVSSTAARYNAYNSIWVDERGVRRTDVIFISNTNSDGIGHYAHMHVDEGVGVVEDLFKLRIGTYTDVAGANTSIVSSTYGFNVLMTGDMSEDSSDENGLELGQNIIFSHQSTFTDEFSFDYTEDGLIIHYNRNESSSPISTSIAYHTEIDDIMLNSTYTASSYRSGQPIDYTFDLIGGALTGVDSQSCVYTGTANNDFESGVSDGLYVMNITVENCSIAGEYIGGIIFASAYPERTRMDILMGSTEYGLLIRGYN